MFLRGAQRGTVPAAGAPAPSEISVQLKASVAAGVISKLSMGTCWGWMCHAAYCARYNTLPIIYYSLAVVVIPLKATGMKP